MPRYRRRWVTCRAGTEHTHTHPPDRPAGHPGWSISRSPGLGGPTVSQAPRPGALDRQCPSNFQCKGFRRDSHRAFRNTRVSSKGYREGGGGCRRCGKRCRRSQQADELLHERAPLLDSLPRRHELRADWIDDSGIHDPLDPLALASLSDQPATPSAACTCSGCRPPQSATLMPWSSIQRTAKWITRRSNRVFASSSSCRTASRY